MITIDQLKAFAHKAEEEIGAAAHAFVAFVERELGAVSADAPAETGSGSDDAGTASVSTDTASVDSAAGATDTAAPAADSASAPSAS